jgi:hypothetical protein
VDRLVLGYAMVSAAIAAVRTGRFPECAWVIVANALVVALVYLLRRDDLGRFGRGLREVYPLVLLVAFYSALDVLNGGGRMPVHDASVQRWEAMLFGGQPSRDWWHAAPSAFWSTLLHAAYFSYYFIVVIPAIVLLRQADRSRLRTYVLAVMTTFVISYVCFALYPVAGPYYAFPRPSARFLDNAAARLVYATLSTGSSYGAAFPSSHVAASVTATWAAFAWSRRLGLALAIPTALLTIGVVYCQMHYAIDAVTGLALGLAVGGLVIGRPTPPKPAGRR